MSSDEPQQFGSPSIDVAFRDTLKDADLASLGCEFGEVALNGLIEEGLLRDIPLIGAAFGVFKIGLSVRDRLLARNIIRFLSEANTIAAATRQEMVQRLDTDPKFGARVGELLIGLLDRSDDARKPGLHGKAFAMYCRRELAADRLRRLHVVIDRVHLPEVDRLALSNVDTLAAEIDSSEALEDPFAERNLTQAGVLMVADRAVSGSRNALTYEGVVLLKLMGRLKDGRINPVW